MAVGKRSTQFFHGSTHDIAVGDYVVPGNQAGKSQWGSQGYGGQKSSEHAFATDNEDTAWMFAHQAGRLARAQAAHFGDEQPGRVRVHVVEPNAEMKPGVYNADHPSHDPEQGDHREWVASKFRTTGHVDIEAEQQGTFPSLNWNQFAHKRIEATEDTNHPTNTQIREGHKESGIPPEGTTPREYAASARAKKTATAEANKPVPKVGDGQLDLLSGKTVEHHAENDHSLVGDYHRNNLSGMTMNDSIIDSLRPGTNFR